MNIKISDDFWDENFYNHPKLTDGMIEVAETSLNVKLPNLLIDLLRVQNGGYVNGLVFPTKEKTSWADSHIALSELYGIVTNKSKETCQNILDSEYLANECGLPAKQVVLSGDGHWFITLDFREGENPTIRWIDLECNQDIHIADTFDEFINGLVSAEEFEEN